MARPRNPSPSRSEPLPARKVSFSIPEIKSPRSVCSLGSRASSQRKSKPPPSPDPIKPLSFPSPSLSSTSDAWPGFQHLPLNASIGFYPGHPLYTPALPPGVSFPWGVTFATLPGIRPHPVAEDEEEQARLDEEHYRKRQVFDLARVESWRRGVLLVSPGRKGWEGLDEGVESVEVGEGAEGESDESGWVDMVDESLKKMAERERSWAPSPESRGGESQDDDKPVEVAGPRSSDRAALRLRELLPRAAKKERVSGSQAMAVWATSPPQGKKKRTPTLSISTPKPASPLRFNTVGLATSPGWAARRGAGGQGISRCPGCRALRIICTHSGWEKRDGEVDKK